MTFHFGRSCVAYIGGVCSKEKGIGVNEVRLTHAAFWVDRLGTLSYSQSKRQMKCHLTSAGCTAVSVLLFQFGSTWTMAASLSQSLAQNLGIQWDPVIRRSKFVSPPAVKLLDFLLLKSTHRLSHSLLCSLRGVRLHGFMGGMYNGRCWVSLNTHIIL